MSMPTAFSPVRLAPLAGLPQTVQLGDDANVRLTIAGMLPDLAALLATPGDRIVRSTASQRRGAPAAADGPVDWQAADASARAALTAPARRTVGDDAALVLLVVRVGTALAAVWPPITGRALEVEHDGRRIGSLWVETLETVAGALVSAGMPGSALEIGWLPGAFEAGSGGRDAHLG